MMQRCLGILGLVTKKRFETAQRAADAIISIREQRVAAQRRQIDDLSGRLAAAENRLPALEAENERLLGRINLLEEIDRTRRELILGRRLGEPMRGKLKAEG
jgi:hypothetical protein